MPSEKKIACYTCITGGYDRLAGPAFVSQNVDYICFTDSKTIQSGIWQIRPIPAELRNISLVKQQRTVKICPHRYLPEYDISIWVDGNLLIIGDVADLVRKYDMTETPFYTRIHPSWNCIYEEARHVLMMKKDRPEIVLPLMQRYKDEGFPERYGLAETCVVMRRHNDPACVAFDNMWGEELLRNSHRDQLSFNYVCWKKRFSPGYMTQEFRINNSIFKYRPHGI